MDTLKEIKNKKVNSFLVPLANPINYTKNLHQTPACKKRAKYNEQTKTDKTRKWFSTKSRRIITERNQRQLKKQQHRNKIRKEIKALQ